MSDRNGSRDMDTSDTQKEVKIVKAILDCEFAISQRRRSRDVDDITYREDDIYRAAVRRIIDEFGAT